MKKFYIILTGLLIGLSTGFNAFGQETWYAITSGEWSNEEIWTLDPAAVLKVNPNGDIPQEDDNVVIKSGRTITMDDDGFQANVMTVDGRLELKSTQNHQFSEIRGSGRILMEQDNFPSGDASHFTSKNQGEGTVVFKGNSFSVSDSYSFYDVDVEMNSGEALTLSHDFVANGDLDVRQGTLRINSNSVVDVDVLGDVTVHPGSSFTVGTNNSVHWLNIHGSLYNNGTMQFSNSEQYDAANNGAVRVRFTGASNEVLEANGTTHFYRLFLDKGHDQTYRLDVSANNPDNFKLFGPIGGGDGIMPDDGEEGWERLALVLNSGTLKLGENIVIPRLGENRDAAVGDHHPKEFHIPENTALWIDGADVSTHEAGGTWRGITIYGKLKISDGSFTNPPNTGGITYFANEGKPGTLEIAGGTVKTTQLKDADGEGQFNYIQSGGELHINSLSDSQGSSAVFALPQESYTFNMSGGEIVISAVNTTDVNGIDIGVGDGNFNVTGGTIEIQTPVLGNEGPFLVNSTAPFYNFSISQSGNDGTQDVTLERELKVQNNLQVNNGTTLDAAGHALSVGNDFDLTGDYVHNDGELRMFGSSNGQIINNSGSELQLNHLIIDKSSTDNSVSLDRGDFSVADDLLVEKGDLDLNDKAVEVNGDISLEKGNVVTENIEQGRLVLRNGSNHILSSKSDDYSMGHVELNNTDGAELSSHVRFGYFTLSDGIMDIGKYRMTVDTPLIVGGDFNNSKMIKSGGKVSDKGLNYNFSLDQTGDIFYPIGVDDSGNKFTPATFTIKDTRESSGSFAVTPVVGKHPASKDEEILGVDFVPLEFYWVTNKEGLESLENNSVGLSFTYHENRSIGGLFNPMRFQNYRQNSGVWDTHGGRRTDLNAINFNDVGTNVEGHFTVAEVDNIVGFNPFYNVQTFYSETDGNWNDNDTWSLNATPGLNDIVIIESGHEVSTNGNGRSAAQIEIKEGGTLDIGSSTGHEFVNIQGDGTFKTSTGNIPDADYGDFMTSETAIFEYSGESYDLPDDLYEYPNLHFTGSGEKNTPDIDLNVHGNLDVNGPTVNVNDDNDVALDVSGDVNVQSGGINFSNHTNSVVNINGKFNMDGGTIDNGAGNVNLYGDFVQSGGTVDFSSSQLTLSLLGDDDAAFETMGGGNSDFYRINVEKSTDNSVEFKGPFTLSANAGENIKPLNLVSGNAWLNHEDIDLTLTSGGYDFRIPNGAGLIVDNGATVDATGDDTGIWLDGLLKIDNGARVLSNGGANNYIEYAASGNARIWVGNTNDVSNETELNVGAQIRRPTNTDAGVLSFVQDKAATDIVIGSKEATVGSRGVFEILNGGSDFEQKEEGSIVTIGRGQVDASVPALIFNPDSYDSAAESGFVIGDANTPDGSTVGLQLSKPLNNLKVALPEDASAQVQTVAANIQEHLEIESGIFDANELDVNLFGDLSNEGTYQSSYNTTYFKGTSAQTITGDVTLHKAIKEGSAVLDQAENSEVTISDDLDILSGVVNTADNQLIVEGDMLIEDGASTQSDEVSDGIMLSGSNTQLLQGAGKIGRLSVSNPVGIVVPSQGGAITFTQQLKLEEGLLDIGRNLLVIEKDADIVAGADGFSETTMIQTNVSVSDAGVQRYLPELTSATEYTIPIGSMGKYTPVVLNVTNNGNDTGSIRVKAANEPHISIAPENKNRVLQYNWTLDAEGIEDFSANVTMQAFSDAVKGNSDEYITARLLDSEKGIWNKYYRDDYDEDADLLTYSFEDMNDAGIDGDYTAGEGDFDDEDPKEDAIPDEVQTFVTQKNGLWNDASTWKIDGSGEVPSGGPHGAIVKVNHRVTVPENDFSAASYMTELGNSGTLDLGSTFGNRLGKVKGSGRIVMQRNAVPAGDYKEFFSEDGGTIEFTGDNDYDVLGEITEVNNLALTGSGDRRLGASDLELNGGLTVDTVNLVNESEIDLSLKGNLTLNNGDFEIRQAMVTFNGDQPQNVGGLSPFSSDNALYSAVIDNSNGISLAQELEVEGSLEIKQGNVVSENSSPLIISNPDLSALQFNSESSYIGTTLAKALTAGDNFEFRVGKDDRYGALNLGSVDASGLWEVEYFNMNPANADAPMDPTSIEGDELQFVSRNEFWRVKAPEAANAHVTVRWDEESGFSADSEETQELRMVEWISGEQWSEIDGTIDHTDGDKSGTILSDNSLDFNEFSAHVDYGSGNFFTLGSTAVYDFTWEGTDNEVWDNPQNWKTGTVPTSNTKVKIPKPSTDGVGDMPVIEGDAYCMDLEIDGADDDEGTVTLRPGATLEIADIVDNRGTIILESTNEDPASLMLPEGVSSGNVDVNLTLAPNKKFYLSSPVKDAKLNWFFPDGDIDNDTVYVFRKDPTWRWIRVDDDYIDGDENSDLNKMEAVYGKYEEGKELDFSGEVYNSDVTKSYGSGYYLVGNPFPTAIDWADNEGWERDGFSQTIWSWVTDEVSGIRVIQTFNHGGNGPPVYTIKHKDYDKGNISHIPPYHAVQMKIEASSADLTIKPSARVKNSDAPLKSSSNDGDSHDLIRIRSDNDYSFDGAVIYFNDSHLPGKGDEDSEKRFNSSEKVPEVYTRIDGKAHAINGLPELSEDEHSVPLSVRNRVEGEVSLSVDLEKFESDYEVFLEDKETGSWINLRDQNEYDYTPAQMGADHDRFVLHFEKMPQIPTDIEDADDEEVKGIEIIGKKEYALVKISHELLQKKEAVIEVLDMNGRLMNTVNTTETESEVDLPDNSGVYMIRVNAGGIVNNEKIVRP